jgi:chromosomal replication initiation ATPase DnaA
VFHNRFSHVDVLLIDDAQVLANRREAQGELLKLITDLRTAGHQIVLTSDRAAAEIQGIDQRLVTELSGGLVVDVARPDFDTRLGIFKKRAEERGAEFGEGVLEAAAKFEVPNVRDLIGALNRMVAYQAVSDSPLTPGAITAMLSDLVSVAGAGEVSGVHAKPAAVQSDFIVGDAALSEYSLPEVSAPKPAPAPAPPPPPPKKAAKPAPAAPAAAAAAAPAPKSGDEFGSFLSGIELTVAKHVEEWKARLGEAILRWEGEGYQTARLGTALDKGDAKHAESTVRQFERDVERLRSFENEMTVLDPAAAGDAVFRDPDRVEEAEAVVRRAREGGAPPGPSGVWAFDGFRVGESNKTAYTAALAVVEAPGARYNPLVLVGPPGCGKTHLLHSIGHALSAGPGALVACLSAQDYSDELMQAVEGSREDQWRSRYRRATAFLLDDVQLLAGKDRAQKELLSLFGHMLGAQRQLAFTISAPPREIEGLDPGLLGRLEGGLVTSVERPDQDLRRSLVERLLTEKAGQADPDLTEYLVSRPAESVRVVATMVQRVLRAAEAEGVPATAAFAREQLEGEANRQARPSVGVRLSGIQLSPQVMVKSHEKLVWQWPEPNDRLIEEMT